MAQVGATCRAYRALACDDSLWIPLHVARFGRRPDASYMQGGARGVNLKVHYGMEVCCFWFDL